MNHFQKKKWIGRLAPLLNKLGINALIRPLFGGKVQILTFHRVVPPSSKARIHNHQSLEISPAHLEQVILFFRERNYQFFSLDQVHEALAKGQLKQKAVIFTFDDGYQDVYQYAYPIFRQYQVPFTIYVSTNFPNQTAILWWYMLETFVLENDQVSFSLKGQTFDLKTTSVPEKEDAFASLRTLILQQGDPLDLRGTLRAIFGEQYDSLLSRMQSMALSWDEIREMARDPLVTIGAHTLNHFPLSQLPAKQLTEEVQGSKIEIEQMLGTTVAHFAYPFGKKTEASQREFEAVKAAGFKTGTTTRIGHIFPEHQSMPEALPRISINQVTDDAVLALQVSGLIPLVVNKGKKVITD